MRKKRNIKKEGVYKIKLSKADEKLLCRYCATNKVGKAVGIKRVLRTYLKDTLPPIEKIPKNQLGLFDPVQKTIFD
ncbi:MAG: hypothetical protein LBM25_03425 [Bacteroidales bacterium]|jgi:hypothetical protein|nr:hypothetical protein [Bacteroidales bacterium]